ncbi:hypothetical protein BH09VER1_BH09VER1_14400 [soil metagenome]
MLHWYDLIIFGVLLYFWMAFSIALHETAHVLVGKAVGFAPREMIVGKGTLLFRRVLLGVDVRWCLSPFGGFAFASRTPLEGLWWRGSLFALAGPLVELLLGVLIGIPLYLEVTNPGDDPTWQIFLCILAASQVGSLVANIFPRDVRTGFGVVANDGKAFLAYITGRRSRDLEQGLKAYAEGVARYEPAFRPGDAWFLEISGAVAREYSQAERDLSERRLDKAVEKYLSLIERQRLSRGEKAMMLDTLAGIPVILGESDYLEEALEWAKRARELCPAAVTLAGTQGSLLVESSRYREGIEMLQPLTGPGNTPGDLAISACYLAKAWDRLGDEKQALYWINFARESGGSPLVCALIEPQLSKRSAAAES